MRLLAWIMFTQASLDQFSVAVCLQISEPDKSDFDTIDLTIINKTT